MKTNVFVLAWLIFVLIITGCATVPTNNAPTPVEEPIALYWENTTEPHPERKAWSDEVIRILKADLSLYASAKDITELCPKFKSLAEADQLKALGEFWVADAYHESGFNPASSSVDVGVKGDPNSYSVGLFQMSGNDGSAQKFGYDYKDLKDPIKNIQVALEQMKRQITKTGLYFLPNASKERYWATLLVGNKYSQIPDIKARVLKNAPKCK